MVSRLTLKAPGLVLLLLLVVGLGLGDNWVSVQANTGCLSGLKNLFGRKASYAKLAEELHRRTDSDKLEDNTREAVTLLNEIALRTQDATRELEDLVRSFSELKDRDGGDSNESLCEPKNIKNLRSVAEAMQRGGNLRPKKVTEPISRLNRVVIKLVKWARSICFDQLAAKWSPNGEEKLAAFGSYTSHNRIRDLRQLPTASLFGNGDTEQMQLLASKLSDMMTVQQAVAQDVDLSSPIRTQIDRILVRPCEEFMAWRSALSVLEPYTDLLVAAHIIEPKMRIMYKFYEDANERPRLKTILHKSVVIAYAYGYRACTIFKSMDKDYLATLITRDRRKALENDEMGF